MGEKSTNYVSPILCVSSQRPCSCCLFHCVPFRDPHPGNIFIGEGGKVSLIDCGQFKSLSRSHRLQIAQLVLAIDQYQKAVVVLAGNNSDFALSMDNITSVVHTAKKELADCARGFGIKCVGGRESDDDLACAIALVLISDTGVALPGNYSSNELSPDSPIRLLTSFPQELILLGRAAVLLKGIAKKLNVPLSLVDRWREQCKDTLKTATTPSLPLWGHRCNYCTGGNTPSFWGNTGTIGEQIRFLQIVGLTKQWAKGKVQRLWRRVVDRFLPPKLKASILELILARSEKTIGL